ncbi:MAG: PBP1A family penicillin-binding protein [Rickettsiales bacterium]|nr:PBP1A family penicillin-binding protein [Rickettsiales bacterium]
MTKKTRSGSDSNFGSMVVSSQDKLYNAKTSKTSKKKPRAKSSKKPKNEPPKKKSFLLVLLQFITLSILWFIGIMAVVIIYYSYDLPDVQVLKEQHRKPMITINASSSFGNEQESRVLTKYGDMYGDYVKAEEMPDHVIHAVIATEDRRFFKHSGVDYIGLIRAFYHNIKAKRIVQGGSTITQQLAKNVFLSSERTIKRKVQELLLAFWLEKFYSKNEILTFYLNRVYFGGGNYGIDAATRFYFDKSVKDISVGEAAIIAGLLKAPSRYSPVSSMQKTQERANQVLINMYNACYLTEEQLIKEEKDPVLISKSGRGVLKNPYFADWVMNSLSAYVGNTNRDMVIESTLDPYLQQVAEMLLEKYLQDHGEKRNVSQGALIAMKPDGKILAMVGGRKYSNSQFNRATNAYRQSGSAFKFFLYLAAFERGKTPDSRYQDKDINIKDWSPKNYNNKQYGKINLKDAFAESVNRVAVLLARDIGIQPVIQVALDLGISSKMNEDLSLVLGTSSVNLLEMVQAYAHIANNGMYVEAYGIEKVTDLNDEVIYKHHKESPTRIVSAKSVAMMNQVMMKVISDGTGKRASIGRPAAGKTGTSQDSRDAWFIGYTPEIVVGVWLGNDNNAPMKRVTGGSLPADLWRDFVAIALAEKPAKPLPLSPHMVDKKQKKYDGIWKNLLERFSSGKVEYEYPD